MSQEPPASARSWHFSESCTHVNPCEQEVVVVFGVGSANRDERCYQDPAAFRLDRPDPWDHVAFGAGPHICPGAALARLEATIALEAFCERVERFALAPDYAFDPNPVFWAHGPRSLAVRIVVAQP